METHIYIETSSRSPKSSDKQYGYILECKVNGEIKTREGFGKVNGTYHKATLTAIIEALERFHKNSEVCIHTANAYILGMLEKNLEKWAVDGYVTSRGKPVANKEEWQKLRQLQEKHLLLVCPEEHSYSEWLRTEMGKCK